MAQRKKWRFYKEMPEIAKMEKGQSRGYGEGERGLQRGKQEAKGRGTSRFDSENMMLDLKGLAETRSLR